LIRGQTTLPLVLSRISPLKRASSSKAKLSLMAR
jgi:hypothetical protein